MFEISNFIRNNFLLCVCTLGLAVIGYIGAHTVRWIIKKCSKTQKIDQAAQNAISQNPSVSRRPLTNRVTDIANSPQKITMGQGEYIVFHKLPNNERKEMSRETYEQVYEILLKNAPTAIINSGCDQAMDQCVNRYERIKTSVKNLDPSLEVVFVPRTLYELIFIRQCIDEDIKGNEICRMLDPFNHPIKHVSRCSPFYELAKENTKYMADRQCWHLAYFGDAGDNKDQGVKDVAYRLNEVMINTLSPAASGLTQQDLSIHVENEIKYLKNHYQHVQDLLDKKMPTILKCDFGGPTTNFGYGWDSSGRGIYPMGIRDDVDAQIIRNAVQLDCSKIAETSFLLYRGSKLDTDSVSRGGIPYSLSYGTSVFAGCLFDGGATAYHYLRNRENDAYAIPVPFDQLNDSPFYIPPTHTIAQLFGKGETFHCRTKGWQGCVSIGGSYNGDELLNFLTTNLKLTKQDHVAQFQSYKNKAIRLK